MIKFIIKNILRFFLLLAIVYTGIFFFVEESSEKAEKTEKSEEWIHGNYRNKELKWTAVDIPQNFQFLSSNFHLSKEIPLLRDRISYHIDHIYFTSYLEMFSLI
ncbi:MAG: hypothetical protein AAGI25_01440 [Bacteroidota bacterium]